ncbi:MAG: class I SAM-dependent methyltransferase [Cyanobacteriota bacterium]
MEKLTTFFRESLNVAGDIYYAGSLLGGSIKAVSKGAYSTESTDYIVLKEIFQRISLKETDVLVDVGCGKGRVINWWLKKGFKNKIYGVELNHSIASKTRIFFKNITNVSILSGDINDQIPQDATFFYLYNPFEPFITETFKKKLVTLPSAEIRVVFYNYHHNSTFDRDPDWAINKEKINIPLLGINDEVMAIIKRNF